MAIDYGMCGSAQIFYIKALAQTQKNKRNMQQGEVS